MPYTDAEIEWAYWSEIDERTRQAVERRVKSEPPDEVLQFPIWFPNIPEWHHERPVRFQEPRRRKSRR